MNRKVVISSMVLTQFGHDILSSCLITHPPSGFSELVDCYHNVVKLHVPENLAITYSIHSSQPISSIILLKLLTFHDHIIGSICLSTSLWCATRFCTLFSPLHVQYSSQRCHFELICNSSPLYRWQSTFLSFSAASYCHNVALLETAISSVSNWMSANFLTGYLTHTKNDWLHYCFTFWYFSHSLQSRLLHLSSAQSSSCSN